MSPFGRTLSAALGLGLGGVLIEQFAHRLGDLLDAPQDHTHALAEPHGEPRQIHLLAQEFGPQPVGLLPSSLQQPSPDSLAVLRLGERAQRQRDNLLGRRAR